jgi:PAS domain S-box-containing protein
MPAPDAGHGADEGFYRVLFEHAADAVLVTDAQARYVEANRAATDLLGYSREELLALSVPQVVSAGPEWGEAEFEGFRSAGTWRGEVELRRKDGSLVVVESVAAEIPTGSGPVYAATLRDVTAAVRGREEQERLLDRLRAVSEISELLAERTDYPAALDEVARRLTDRAGDVCLIDVVDDFGRMTRVAARHRRPELQPKVSRLSELVNLDAASYPSSVSVRSGRATYLEEVSEEYVAGLGLPDEGRRLVRELGYRSFLSVPLEARGRLIGAVTVISTSVARRYTQQDVGPLEEIARRIAVRMDNARLYAERDSIVRALQAALLPPRLPKVTGVTMASRYETADHGRVGGDFYDVIELPDERLLLVIGDVCGKGPEAAAVTGLARHTVRAVAVHERHPSAVLSALNEVLLADERSTLFVTAACALLDPATGAAVVCVAGHPAPLLVSGTSVEVLQCPSGLLLGEYAEVGLVDVRTEVADGQALVLFTDGLLGGLAEVEDLATRLEVAPGWDAEALATAVVRSGSSNASDPARRDDVAVLVAHRD